MKVFLVWNVFINARLLADNSISHNVVSSNSSSNIINAFLVIIIIGFCCISHYVNVLNTMHFVP